MMKKILWEALLLCAFVAVFAAELPDALDAMSVQDSADALEFSDVLVKKIRLFIDDAEYVWTSSGVERVDDGNLRAVSIALSEETVVSFLSVFPGFSASEDKIVRRCEESERRMKASGYFYDVSILIIPQRLALTERTLVVTVSSGFFMRYGGGNAWGMLGKVAISGERQSLYAYAGYNRNGLSYLHSRVGGSPLALGGSLFYFGPGEYSGKLDTEDLGNRFSSVFTSGWSFTPDLFVAIAPTIDGFGFSSGGIFSLQPYVRQRKYLSVGRNSESGFELRGFWYPSFDVVKGEGGGYLRVGFSNKLVFAIKASAGYSPFDVPDLPLEAYFDLYYIEDNNVRSGYSLNELIASDYVLGSTELRYNFLEFKIPPIFDVTTQAFVYTDVARLANNFRDAYGLGLRILFENPVFAYFTFSYGINHEGKGRFLFCGTAGY